MPEHVAFATQPQNQYEWHEQEHIDTKAWVGTNTKTPPRARQSGPVSRIYAVDMIQTVED